MNELFRFVYYFRVDTHTCINFAQNSKSNADAISTVDDSTFQRTFRYCSTLLRWKHCDCLWYLPRYNLSNIFLFSFNSMRIQLQFISVYEKMRHIYPFEWQVCGPVLHEACRTSSWWRTGNTCAWKPAVVPIRDTWARSRTLRSFPRTAIAIDDTRTKFSTSV